MDYGLIALVIVGVIVGGALLLGLLSFLASFYYFDHR